MLEWRSERAATLARHVESPAMPAARRLTAPRTRIAAMMPKVERGGGEEHQHRDQQRRASPKISA